VSPLLANIYLHELDKWWWERYGGLSRAQKAARRRNKQGNVVLVRYADDFILLTNGPKQEALRLREEVGQFLKETLHLELAPEKTHVTHVSEGFDFLGFRLHLRTKPKGRHRGGKACLVVTPTQKNVNRFRDKVRAMLHHKRRTDDPVAKLMALNRVLRGWRHYYRYVSAGPITHQLDHWTFKTTLAWLAAHHGRGVKWAWRQYVHQQGSRKNLAVYKTDGTRLYRKVMMDIPQRVYWIDWSRGNPYLTESGRTVQPQRPDVPLIEQEWEGRTGKRIELRYEALRRDQHTCQQCGGRTSLEVHHRKRYRPQDRPKLGDLSTLCRTCHAGVHA
jgi:hypothetical protein